MIYEAKICNEFNQRTAGYNKPVIQLTDPKVYTSPISGDMIRVDDFPKSECVVYIILQVEQNFSNKFKCKLLTPLGSIIAGWIFKKI